MDARGDMGMAAYTQFEKNCYEVIKVDITNDTFCIVRSAGKKEPKLKISTEMRTGLAEKWNEYHKNSLVHEGDISDFNEYMTLDFVASFFQKYHGEEIFEMDVQYKAGEEYVPIHIEIVAAVEYSDEHQVVYVFLKRAGYKLREDYVHFDDLLRGLSENYGAIYYVDFDKNQIRPFRMNEAIEKSFGEYFRSLPTYDAAIKDYIDTVVSDKDKDDMYAVTQYEFLKKQLKDVRAYSHEYRLERDGREHVFRFKVANLEGVGELHKAVFGFADVSSEKTNEISYDQVGKKILIVEHNAANRKLLVDILSPKYELLEVEDGQAALTLLGDSYEEIALVISGLQMPNMGGYELVKHMKRNRQYSNIPIIIATGADINDLSRKEALEIECLEFGAADIILRPYNPRIVLNRIRRIIRLRDSMSMLHTLEKDPLTGLYAKEFFYQRVERFLEENPDEKVLMWATDIEGLKVINEKYGIEMGDEILKMQASNRGELDGFIIGGRIEGDKFAALIKECMLPKVIEMAKEPDMGIPFPVPNVVIRSGIYHIRHQSSLRPQGMYDRALLAVQKIKDTYGTYFAEYDDDLRKDLLMQRQVAENAENALKEHQFVVYYQPKFGLHVGKTCGAEALVRWIHPDLGFMNPGVFIPIFEQNGFIKRLDFYVWEEVCKALKSWKEQGMCMVPVSVNVSRRDFEDEQLAEKVIAIVDSYGIDHSYFHIEVTESSYSDNPHRIVEIIRKFHDSGFVVELDDFGAGYSSMTALSELDLDIMKLDMSIIRNDNPKSDKNILEFSMQLAKMIGLQTVAEGVETQEQVNRITSLGGDYIQGYFYSKPLAKEQFEQYLLKEVNYA